MVSFSLQKLSAQSTRPDVHPLKGQNSIGLHVGLLPMASIIDPGVLPSISSDRSFNNTAAIGRVVGIRLSRYLPDLFVTNTTTAEFGLSWMSIDQQFTDTEQQSFVEGGDSLQRTIHQQTDATVSVLAASLTFELDTSPGKQISPTINLGLSVGHIFGIEYATSITPDGAVAVSEDGLPVTGAEPDRRYFYGNVRGGFGARINLGQPGSSIAIVPKFEILLPISSALRTGAWLPFGTDLGLTIRVPL